MSTIKLRIHVGPDHTITGTAPADLPPGEHEVVLATTPSVTPPTVPFRIADFPMVDWPWDDSISLRREDMYGDDGH